MMVPFPPFEPDKSPFNAAATDLATNCLPVADGWGPMSTFEVQSVALPEECLGAVYVRNSSGSNSIFAGTASNLYRLSTAAFPYEWTEISVSTDAYSVPTGDRWQFDVFGDLLIATQLGNYPQYINTDSGTAFGNLTTSFKARHVRAVGDFVMFGYLENEPTKVRWSGLNDATFWSSGQRGADEQIMPSGGDVMGIIGDQRGALVILRNAMDYMAFAPSSGYTFTRSQANTKRGTVAPYSIVQIGQDQFAYLSEDGFFSGVSGEPIGAERVDRWFLDDLDRQYLTSVRGMADPFNKIVWWRYQTVSGASRLIGYDWQLNRWCYSDQQVTDAAALTTPNISWDGLDTLYDTIDDADEPFHSPLFLGGKPLFAGFTSENKLAFAGGANAAATIATAWVEPAPDRRLMANDGRVVINTGEFTIEAGGVDFHGDTEAYKTAVTPSTRTGKLPLRSDAKLHRFRLNVTAGASWDTVTGIDVNFAAGGQL